MNAEKESQKALTKVEETIQKELECRGPEASAKYEAFLKRMERSEDTQRNILSEKRERKLLQLTPHTRTRAYLPQYTRTLSPQTTTLARKTLGLYPVKHGRGKGPTKDITSYIRLTEFLIKPCINQGKDQPSFPRPQPLRWI